MATKGNNHRLEGLKPGENTIAYWALDKEPVNLVLFVHGFGGRSIKSWNDFPALLKKDDLYRKTDFIFYGYKSRVNPVVGSAELFYTHIKELIQKDYSKIMIVAHSMGAIVIRRMLLDALRDKVQPSWLNKCRFILFAPAHRGAVQQKLLFEILPPSLSIFASIARLKYVALNDLDEHSTVIKDLIEDTKRYLSNPDNDHITKAHYIVASVEDRVVVKGHFCEDPNPEPVEGKGHVAVCKPIIDKYLIPMNAVKKGVIV